MARKNVQKVLALLLAFSLAMSLLSVSALAGELVDKANQDLEEARTTLAQAEQDLETAQAAWDEANAAYTPLKEEYDAQVAAVDTTARDEAQTALNEAEAAAESADAAKSEAEKALTDAETAAEADPENTDLAEAVTAAQETLDQKTTEAEGAAAALEVAQGAYEEAQAAYEAAVGAIVVEGLEDAAAALDLAQHTLDDASKAVEDAKDAVTAAEAALATAYDKEAAQPVMDSAQALLDKGTLTAEDKEAVDAIYAAYQALTETQRALAKETVDALLSSADSLYYSWDEESATLTYTGLAFSCEIFTDAAQPFNEAAYTIPAGPGTSKQNVYPTKVKTLVLDNPEMVTSAYSFDTSGNTYILGVEKIIVEHADIISEKTFYYNLEKSSIRELELHNVTEVGQLAFANVTTNPVERLVLDHVGTFPSQAFGNLTRTVEVLEVDTVESLGASINVTSEEEVIVSNVGTLSGAISAKFLTLRQVDTISASYPMNRVVETLSLEGVKKIEDPYKQFFSAPIYLRTLTIDSPELVIPKNSFYGCISLETLNVISCAAIEGGCFEARTSSSPELTISIPDSTRLGYSTAFAGNPDLTARMEAILDGQFQLNPATGEDGVTLSQDTTYTSSRVGTSNSASLDGTQVTKSAKWSNTDSTRAEVQFQFRYAQNQGLDFLFVLDYSASMAMLGTDSAQNSRYYDLQSKVLDVSEELLSTAGYDNRVGILTFNGYASSKYPGEFNSVAFQEDAAALQSAYSEIQHDGQTGNTDYITALTKAKELVDSRMDASRQAVIIFISDGAPTVDKNQGLYVPEGERLSGKKGYIGGAEWRQMLPDIEAAADALKNTGVKIFGVTQSVPESEQATCREVMDLVCTNGLVFTSQDTAGFSKAVNDAVGAAYSIHTITDVVDPDFDLDESSIRVSAGSTQVSEDAEGRTVITWTITGTPYMTHTMTYQANLLQRSGAYPTGSFDTNEGNAAVADEKGTEVNEVPTPVLERTGSTTTPDTPGGTGSDPSNPPAELPEEDVPLGELPGETPSDIPEKDVPLTDLPEEDVPLSEAPKTGDLSALWLVLTAVSGSGLAATGLLNRKKRGED